MEQYKSVSNYQDLINLNIDFIEGKINWTPYNQKPYEPGQLKEDLIETNRLGFLTLGGQSAVDTSIEEKKLFLDGYLKPDLVRNFIKYLKQFKKIEYYIEFLSTKEIKTNIRNWHNAYNFKENQSLYYNSLARVKKDQEWQNTDTLPFRDLSYITLKYWNGYPNILNILKDYCFVHIQHRSFHNLNNDLYNVINGYLKNPGSFKPKKQKKNHFGKSTVRKLKELVSDLKLVSSKPNNNLVSSKPNNNLVVNFGTVKKQSLYVRAKKHAKKHKWKYAAVLANAIALTAVKNKVNRVLNKPRERKKEMRDAIIAEQQAKEQLENTKKMFNDLLDEREKKNK